MNFQPTEIPDILIIEPKVFSDSRGYFMETYQQQRMESAGINFQFVQDNQSRSSKGTLRGLHYQINHPQGKLFRVIQGEVFDVAVDLRRSSATFGKWVGVILSAENKKQLWIPPGFAHGFYAISDWVEVFYKATDYYSPENERSILWNDPEIGIKWPINKTTELIISAKDSQGSSFSNAETYV
jgi:dTDP-4-dehydrorhamnose 3,5-epimerase